MKTLFIIVSIIALSYLTLQNSIVKAYVSEFSRPFDISDKAVRAPVTAASEYEELKLKISELTQYSEQENKVFRQRISELQQNIETIANDVNSLNAEPLSVNLKENMPKQVVAQQDEVVQQPEIVPQVDLSSGVTTKDSSVTPDGAHISQQQKRIQQQAILRGLSQKMELAALSSLVD